MEETSVGKEKEDRALVNSLEDQVRGEISKVEQAIGGSGDHGRDVSAATIGRMMGIATISDLKLVESKLDLMATKVANVTTRLEKALALLARMPTGADLERIDVQIGALRNLIRDTMSTVAGEALSNKSSERKPMAGGSSSGPKIITNAAPKVEEKPAE